MMATDIIEIDATSAEKWKKTSLILIRANCMVPGFSRILVVNMCLGIGYSDCAFARLRILCSII